MSNQPHPPLPPLAMLAVINAQDLPARTKRVAQAAYLAAETLDDKPAMEAICELAETVMDRIEEASFLLDQYRAQHAEAAQ